jgi:hypothetical protein
MVGDRPDRENKADEQTESQRGLNPVMLGPGF